MVKKCLVHKGFVYELFMEGKFIEHFDSVEAAKAYVDDVAATCHFGSFIIKPLAFFTMVEEHNIKG